MGLFDVKKFERKKKTQTLSYDRENKIPAIRASICTGEQVAGFKDIHTGKFDEVTLIRNEAELESFRKSYGIDGDIVKIY